MKIGYGSELDMYFPSAWKTRKPDTCKRHARVTQHLNSHRDMVTAP